MASPTSDLYPVADATAVRGGRGTPSATPAWRAAMTAGTWAVVGNTLSDVNPRYDAAVNPNYPSPPPWWAGGHASVTAAWCGAVWVEEQRRLLIGPNGGHTDYAGNETYAWSAATGLFTRLNNPSGSIGAPAISTYLNADIGVYEDGRVKAYHSYANFAVRGGEAWFFGGASYSNTAKPHSRVWKWAGSDWADQSGSASTLMSGLGHGVCHDTLRDVFWHGSQGTTVITSYDPTANFIESHSPYYWNASGYITPFYDYRRDLVLGISDRLQAFLPAAPAMPAVLTTAGAWPPVEVNGSTLWTGRAGIAQDVAGDRYLLWTGGATIYTLTPPAVGLDPLTNQWTWGQLTLDPANAVTPPARGPNGTYGRFWHSPSLACCGVVNDTTSQMHVYALA